MAVTTTTTRHSFNGSGSAYSSGGTPVGQGPVSINFTVIDATHIDVYWTKASSGAGTPTSLSVSGNLTINTHYTIQNAGTGSTATITWVESGWTADSTVTFPTSSDLIVITRNVPLTQVTNYQNNATIDAETIEASFDKLAQTAQQLSDDKDYSFKFASNLSGATGFDSTADTASTITIGKTARANKVVGFDADGNVQATQEIGSFLGNWAASTAYVARDIVKDASNSNIYICNTSHTSTGSTPVSGNTDVAKWTLIVDAASTTTSATASATSATASATSATASATSATASATSATASATSATASATSATASATSATASAASATASSASEVAARNSAASVANTYDSFDDIYLGKMADSATQGTNPTTNGTWAKDSSAITVASGSNIKVGQVVTGTGMPSPPPNVISVAGTAVVVSAPMAAAGSAVSLTFTGYGVYGTYNGTKDGPTTDNDNGALADGMLYFNTTDNNMMVYKTTGAAWIPASSSGSISLIVHKFTASGSETSIAAASFSPTLSYTPANIIVFLNGVRLDATDYTATTGTTITGLAALAASDEVVVYAFKSFEVADAVSAASGGTFSGNVSFGDNNITNVGSIALDSISADGTEITISSDMETATNKKIKQKGAFMQSSTHQAWVLGG